MLAGALEYYRTHPVDFIQHWCSTYDPRHAGQDGKITTMPFALFRRQADMVHFLYDCLDNQRSGLIEKARDMGATWTCVGVSVHLWRFLRGAAIGWGSRKQELVDELGITDSILEKIRMTIRNLPRIFWPTGFDPTVHMPFMRIINPDSGATITGETGDNIGRGGRKLIYFKDEAAHYERPEKIEAALSANTRVQIDISSVNGLNNPFHNKRKIGVEWPSSEPIPAGKPAIFVMDWSHHPEKDQAWYDVERRSWEERGLLYVFSQEVDRNYAASVSGIVIRPEWVNAAVDAHKKLGFDDEGPTIAGLDVADDTPNGDLNALTIRKGSIVKSVEDWGGIDTGKTTRKVVGMVRPFGRVMLQYDAIGLGASVKSESNRLVEAQEIDGNVLTFHPWFASARVLKPDRHIIRRDDGSYDKQSPLNKDHFANLKAQAWYEVAMRFYRTFQAVTEGRKVDPDLLVSIPSDMPNRVKLQTELSQATYSTDSKSSKIVINKTPDGTRSPNMADSFVMAFWPVSVGGLVYSAETLG